MFTASIVVAPCGLDGDHEMRYVHQAIVEKTVRSRMRFGRGAHAYALPVRRYAQSLARVGEEVSLSTVTRNHEGRREAWRATRTFWWHNQGVSKHSTLHFNRISTTANSSISSSIAFVQHGRTCLSLFATRKERPAPRTYMSFCDQMSRSNTDTAPGPLRTHR